MGDPGNSVRCGFRLASAILVMMSGVAVDTSLGASWSRINTGLPSIPVDVSALAIAPAAPATLYANTSGPNGTGGIFKTTDGALTWTAISSVAGVNFSLIVVDPQNPSTIYVLSGGGLRKSTDAGESWIDAGSGLPDTYVGALAIDPVTPSTLYAGGAGSIFRSADGGGSWDVLNTGLAPNAFIRYLVIDPSAPSRIYATGSVPQPGGPPGAVILRSVDGGENWNVLDTGLPSNSSIGPIVMSPATPSTIYVNFVLVGPGGPGGGAGTLKSVDGGDTWNTFDTGLPSGASVVSLVIDPKNSSTIYLVVLFPFAEAGGILKSTNGGTSWKSIGAGLPANTAIQSLVIDPGASSTIYMIVDAGVFKSTDGGANWNSATTGLTTIDVGALATNRFDPATVYAAAGDSVFKSIDSGATWTKLFAFQLSLPSLPPFLSPPFPDGAPAYPRSLLIDAVDPDILYAATSRGNSCFFADNLLFKSTDGGVSWSDSVSPDKSGCVLSGVIGPSAGLKALDPTDPNTLYAAETDDEDISYSLLRSKDGGASWNAIENYPGDMQAGVWALAIDPVNPATLYAGLDDVPEYSDTDDTVTPGLGGAFKSTDGGASWNSIGLSGSAVYLLSIDPARPSVLYAGTEGNYGVQGFRGLFKSVDSGASWSPIDNGLAGLLGIGSGLTAFVIDPANSDILYAGASGGGVFKSSDGGANWSRFNDGLANLDVRGLAIAPGSQHTLYAGTSGGVFKVIDDAP